MTPKHEGLFSESREFSLTLEGCLGKARQPGIAKEPAGSWKAARLGTFEAVLDASIEVEVDSVSEVLDACAAAE
jgi:hypothetical protein